MRHSCGENDRQAPSSRVTEFVRHVPTYVTSVKYAVLTLSMLFCRRFVHVYLVLIQLFRLNTTKQEILIIRRNIRKRHEVISSRAIIEADTLGRHVKPQNFDVWLQGRC